MADTASSGAPDETAATPSPDGRGSSQSGVRLYNERLILSLIRRHRSLTKVEIARLTGLSTQTTTVVINRLEADGLLLPGERQRGRIGQPAVPYSLNPEGAFGLGMMIGRRSCDLMLMDFVAGIRARRRITYAYPVPAALLGFAAGNLPELAGTLDARQRDRITGLGVAMPFELWNWEAELGMVPGTLGDWRRFDIAAELSRLVAPWPVRLANDATSACAAELTFGQGSAYRDFAYLYVGAFIGGGIVLNGTLFPGRSGNAGALGSMPVLRRDGEAGPALQQLIRSASIYRLERRLIAAGRAGTAIWASPDDWSDFAAPLEAWIDEAADGLAQAVAAILSVIDFEAVVVDGAFPAEVRGRLVERTRRRFAALDRQGLTDAAIVEGSVGRDARSIGAAALPLLATFARDSDVLFKVAP
ncbi:Sugar kinase of the NBD/HSP70 family, may contain an N-terminal HTH domain [Tistlia consotensis]|uniref:Sugar kinase of the NBD/HSP70 family, may contain an N-terminal HTH domain n=1 Tax=Tistlia consotensis USBA 355 TaxID=560819 RepID=A0A1Y6CPA3_9PROT|nr:ROK family transcriptional regulator [Tistlia consotensis]SMF65731.1 Sugar kinase of the NBD/HSP70 family, may contain an N-terminal HTH domain [Tistlia consotensis USBA 355]SNS03242.1 Sugar kinase of the NBD/HSP70 family, may contain an N-terminal HTH domain [Tistlia consotensis]